MFTQAKNFLNDNTYEISDWTLFKKQIKLGGFIKCGWDGNPDTEQLIKKNTKATVRCILSESPGNLKCIYTNDNAKYEVIFAKSY